MNRLAWVAALVMLMGCGAERPNSAGIRANYRSVDKNSADQIPVTPVPTPTPEPTPLPGAYAGRALATTKELVAARDLYNNECSICHSPFEQSTKRSVTVTRLNAACVPMAVPLHMDLIRREVWPKDVKDTKDDGVDTATLNASALAEVMK